VAEFLKEHLGEIALLIYILYPLFKRWSERRKRQRERSGQAPAKTAEAPKPKPAPPSAPIPERIRAPQPGPAPVVAKRPTETDFLAAAQIQLDRLKQEASRQLTLAENDARLVRLVPAFREDLLDRLETIERSLRSHPTPSTIVQDSTVLRDLESLLHHLKMMAQRRVQHGSPFLGAADKMVDACYAPMLAFARTRGLELTANQPLVVPGDWPHYSVPRFAPTRIAPLRLPAGLEQSLWRWPTIAHEVAHDFYYGLHGFDRQLHDRLGLPENVDLPRSSQDVDGAWLRRLFGAWLPEIFADTIGTLLLGPAHAETMRRAFRNPVSAQRTAAIFQTNGRIDEQPPARLRLYMAKRILHHLGRHTEADALWAQWEGEHPEVRFYYLPLGGQWVGLSDEALHSIADSLIDGLLQQSWPELDGFALLHIPGLAYLHAEHVTVERFAGSLARGQTVNGDARWIIAAAVLAAAAQPTLHDHILETAKQSIVGIRAKELMTPSPQPGRRIEQSIGRALVTSLSQPRALDEAIAVAAAITSYKPPRWH